VQKVARRGYIVSDEVGGGTVYRLSPTAEKILKAERLKCSPPPVAPGALIDFEGKPFEPRLTRDVG
jgi:hypothetical protein